MNQNLFREDVLKIVQESVRDKNFRVDLKNPDVCFVFEVIKSNKMDSSFTSGIVKTPSLTSSHFSQRLTIVESTGTRGLCVY